MIMKKFVLITTSLLLGMVLGSGASFAGELSYTPINPSFGGSPFNGSNLMSGANAINNFKDPDQPSFEQSLADRLDSLVLSQLVSRLVSNTLDDPTFAGGTFNTGVNSISIQTVGNVTTIEITNNETGETTTIQIPSI